MKCSVTPNLNLKNIKLTIGLCGGRLSGKDYIANIISDYTDIPISSLADPIKKQYSTLMDISIKDLYTQGTKKELHRLGLITLGAIRRDQHIDWWCEDLHENFSNKSVIIPDIRFKNEVEYFKSHSSMFILFNVMADNSSLISRGWKQTFADKTTTETERLLFKDSITKTINNSCQFEKSIRKRLAVILKEYNLLLN